MASSTFVTLRDLKDPDMARVQANIAQAFEALAAQIPASPTRFYSTLLAGRNGPGYIALGPHKDVAGNVLARAKVGDQVVTAWDITAGQDLLFARFIEPTITKTDQIKQLDGTNRTAHVLLLTVVGS